MAFFSSKQFTVVMLHVYHDAAERQIDEAEELINRGIALRMSAIAMLDRASELAYEYSEEPQPLPVYDDIDW